MVKHKLPKLPSMLNRKLYKTGTTRGADDSQIYQNRVKRNDTVLVPFNDLINDTRIQHELRSNIFENGYIVLISPKDFFNKTFHKYKNLKLGKNLLIFFRNRKTWNQYRSLLLRKKWVPAHNRSGDLGGEYVARIPNTTSNRSNKIYKGFTSTKNKGAGIRLYEYSSLQNIKNCRLQLEAIFWLCKDSNKVMLDAGMLSSDIQIRKNIQLTHAKAKGLLNKKKLIAARIINNKGITICPLCRQEISAKGFITHKSIPKGRNVPDLTITQNNLFHIHGLQYGEFSHKPYNLGWGHHYCNLVQADHSISYTLDWMKQVLTDNETFISNLNK